MRLTDDVASLVRDKDLSAVEKSEAIEVATEDFENKLFEFIGEEMQALELFEKQDIEFIQSRVYVFLQRAL